MRMSLLFIIVSVVVTGSLGLFYLFSGQAPAPAISMVLCMSALAFAFLGCESVESDRDMHKLRTNGIKMTGSMLVFAGIARDLANGKIKGEDVRVNPQLSIKVLPNGIEELSMNLQARGLTDAGCDAIERITNEFNLKDMMPARGYGARENVTVRHANNKG